MPLIVSTHSRLKAAAISLTACLNFGEFQHTAARRQLQSIQGAGGVFLVSTHSRPKAAGPVAHYSIAKSGFNTQPPEGGCKGEVMTNMTKDVSTHSRPKAAERACIRQRCQLCFNTQPPEGGCSASAMLRLKLSVSTHSRPKAAATTISCCLTCLPFQHTAARRRLILLLPDLR